MLQPVTCVYVWLGEGGETQVLVDCMMSVWWRGPQAMACQAVDRLRGRGEERRGGEGASKLNPSCQTHTLQ